MKNVQKELELEDLYLVPRFKSLFEGKYIEKTNCYCKEFNQKNEFSNNHNDQEPFIFLNLGLEFSNDKHKSSYSIPYSLYRYFNSKVNKDCLKCGSNFISVQKMSVLPNYLIIHLTKNFSYSSKIEGLYEIDLTNYTSPDIQRKYFVQGFKFIYFHYVFNQKIKGSYKQLSFI